MNILENSLVLNTCIAGGATTISDGIMDFKSLPFLSIAQSVVGTYEIALGDDTSVFTEEGGCFVAPPNIRQAITHHISPSSNNMVFRWVFLDLMVGKYTSIDKFLLLPKTISPADSIRIGDLINELLEINQSVSIHDSIQKQRIGFCIFEELLKVSSFTNFNFPAELLEIITFMENNMKSGISNNDLANMVGLSESRFCHFFKEKVGLSPNKYFMQIKLKAASYLLLSTKNSISSIANDTGFYDQFFFSKEFKKAFGVNPLSFRNNFNDKMK